MNGIINVLKPTGMSSHDVVSFIRRTLNMKKIGHTGTLDPNAAGILPICVGKATKISQYLIEKTKKYRCELTLGAETDTQDKYGNIINESQIHVNEKEIRAAFNGFKGDLEQIPPMYSAVRHKGKKLYELARQGQQVERKSRKITIYDLEIIHIQDNKKILFDVKCSKGTYMRTLCNDIGQKLGTYGHMSFLLRTEVDIFKLNDSFTIEEIDSYAQNEEISKILLPIDYPLSHYNEISLEQKFKKILLNGGKIPCAKLNKKYNILDEKYRIYCNKDFIGIGRIINQNNQDYLKLEKLLIQGES